VQQNSMALQERLAERQKLLSQLDQAKMQEQLNAAMGELSQTVNSDVPSLDQVRDKIEARYAKAVGTQELTGNTVETRMLEVQQATIGIAARSRLDEIRAQMGLTEEAPAVSAPAAADGELGAAPAPDQSAAPGTPAAEPAPQEGNAG
jgi:phage shock protein A